MTVTTFHWLDRHLKMLRLALMASFALMLILSVSLIFGAEDGVSYFGKENEADQSEVCTAERGCEYPVNIVFTFANAVGNLVLKKQFTLTISSLFEHVSIPLKIYIIGDRPSQELAEKMIRSQDTKVNYEVVFLNVDELKTELESIVKPLQLRFGHKPGAYYYNAIFYLSTALHRVMPSSVEKVIMLDADLKFRHDIKLLYEQFNNFNASNIMGIAHEMQPVYRHIYYSHRNKHKGTRVGEPPPLGLTGFNSGVLLLHLNRMRESEFYNSMLNEDRINAMVEKYNIKGHLGDQDFFTMLSMEHEELFYVLPCVFNYQLCTWWKDHGYKDVFHLYHTCEGEVIIYHGNGKTSIPND